MEPLSKPAFTILEVAPSIVVVSFTNPGERNPLSIRTIAGLTDSLPATLKRQDIKTIIFTGTDDVFASGADIRELAQLSSGSAKQFSEMGQRLFQLVANAHQLTIAAINGYCMGGALDLALACKLRIASNDAVFAHPGARLGIITGWGGTQRLPRLIGKARALEFFASARQLGADEALRIGLVDDVGDPVLDRALVVAGETYSTRTLGARYSPSSSHSNRQRRY